ncbi:MAG: glutathione S-transferase family protein [Rubrobacteraceae bacterium]
MGMLVEGTWKTGDVPKDEEGRFVRQATTFRGRISADGSSGFVAEAGRYHLYVAWACPWAHRTAILRKVKGLEDATSLSSVQPFMGSEGWTFSEDFPDPLFGMSHLSDIYVKADPEYTGRVTTPVLWDRETNSIVNNESREIIRMLDHEFGEISNDKDFCPPDLEGEVERVLDEIYEPINNGVYRSGFARTQGAYDEAVTELFDALDRWEDVLSTQRYLCGDRVTEADWAMFTTLVRFDAVYHGHFKCNVRRIVDYPNLWGYLRDLYQCPGVSETVFLDQIKTHYYSSHETVNPTRIVPKGPVIDFTTPHGREKLQKYVV